MEIYDVIIVGGGPAGLSVGSELSRELDILVIEKGKVGETTRSWFVPKDVVDKNEDIIDYTYGGVSAFLTKTYSGKPLRWDARLFDRYPFIKEKEILNYWKECIISNGSHILEETLFLDHRVEEEYVHVETLEGSFKSRLIIDASGSDSVILNKYEIDPDNYYWWSVYGCLGTHPDGISGSVGDYMLWQTFQDTNANPLASLREGRPVFEYEYLDENRSFSLILYLRKQKMPLEFMEKKFKHIIRNEETTRDFHNIEVEEYKYGWYPSGGLMQKLARDRVDFIGDAGCWTTPCGWGMGFILNNYKEYAGRLVQLVKEDMLDRNSLYTLLKMEAFDKYQLLLDQVIVHFLANASAKQLDEFINVFRKINPVVCEKMFTLRLDRHEIIEFLCIVVREFDIKELIRILPNRSLLKILQIVRYGVSSYFKDRSFSILKGTSPIKPKGAGFNIGG